MDSQKMTMMAKSISAGLKAVVAEFDLDPREAQKAFAIGMAECIAGSMDDKKMAEEVDTLLADYLEKVSRR